MKNIISLFLIFCGVTSFAQKAEYDVINNFLEVELSKMNYDTIFVIEMPLQRSESVKLYEKSFHERLVNNDYRETWVIPEMIDWPINQDEIDLLKKEIKKENEKWTLSDFKNKKIIILPEKTIRGKDFIVSNISAKNYVFNLSRPVLNTQKDFAVFQFYPSLLIGGGSSDLAGLILMKKHNKKWIQIAVIQNAVYN
ncbi:hypothetical protein [Flavobacterium suzhouense]|uniref:GLPGLI family protein n=1 Tax=Flavobacterium suzhouense TaxID=1529638 RepID=A0ABW5NTP9_9FLAO